MSIDAVLPDATQVDAATTRPRDAGYAVVAAGDAWVARDPWDIAVRLTAGR